MFSSRIQLGFKLRLQCMDAGIFKDPHRKVGRSVSELDRRTFIGGSWLLVVCSLVVDILQAPTDG
jgi:hypothetical protein